MIREERAGMMKMLRDSERKRRMNLVFAWGLEFLLRIVIWWCTCLLGHSGTGRIRTSVQASSISHLCPKARGLGVRVSVVSGLGKCT